MPVVGTAGHVDHGKSSLVQALTGRDPDRWAEEKRRGLTIDLGFAWTVLPSGTGVGFIDVPGHERFIKNMLAGVDAIDVAVFVVAADEGWMPQSEEHLAVLDLLGISHGIVALTRCDLVDEDMIELMTLEVDERLAGTSLAGSPVIPTSVPSGRGLDELRRALDDALATTSIVDVGRPRMWIDRAFTIGGAGTVVTGTLVDGAIGVDDALALFPGRIAARVRSIQSHEESVTSIGPGNRTALNVVGIEREAVERGAMLGRSEDWAPTGRFTGDVRTVRSLDAPLREQGSFHLHAGSGSWPVRIRLLEGETLQGQGAMVVDLPTALPLRVGDRFILREVGRQSVVAGGRVLDPAPPRRVRESVPMLPALRAATGPDSAATALLEARGQTDLQELSAQTGGGRPGTGLLTDRRGYSDRRVAQLGERARRIAEEYQTANPLRPGVPRASMAEQLRVPPEDLEAILQRVDGVETDGPAVHTSGFGGDLTGPARQMWEATQRAMLDAGFSPPRRKELELDREVLHALIRSGRLVEISDELVYLPETLQLVMEHTRQMPDGFTVADFRDALGITRKYAVPLLEWMDATGVTRREGEGRTLR